MNKEEFNEHMARRTGLSPERVETAFARMSVALRKSEGNAHVAGESKRLDEKSRVPDRLLTATMNPIFDILSARRLLGNGMAYRQLQFQKKDREIRARFGNSIPNT